MRLRTSTSIFSSSRNTLVMVCTICWRMVSRSSMNSTSLLCTNRSTIWCEMRTIFSRLNLIRFSPTRSLPEILALPQLSQNQLTVPRDLSLNLLEHFLIRNARAPHFILVLRQDVAHLVVNLILDGNLFHHAQTHAGDYRFH